MTWQECWHDRVPRWLLLVHGLSRTGGWLDVTRGGRCANLPNMPLGRSMQGVSVLGVALSLLCAASVLGWPNGGVGQNEIARKPFTAEEKRTLQAGRLVMRSTIEKRGKRELFGGASWQIVDVPVDALWKAIKDVPRFDRLMPEVHEASIVQVLNPSLWRVRVEHRLGPVSIDYHVRATVHEDRKDATFLLERTEDSNIRSAWGFFTARPYGKKRSLLSYGVMADLGNGLVAGALRLLVHEWMLKVPWTMKRFIEGSGRPRYVVAAR